MRSVKSSFEAPQTSYKPARRLTAMVLAGSLGLGLTGCSMFGNGGTPKSGALRACKAGWEAPTALTYDPSAADTAMQRGIAQLIDEIVKSGAKGDGYGNGYRLSSIPNNLVGTANAVLNRFPDDDYVAPSSSLQNYANEVCVDPDTQLTYLTPDYLSAVGSLAAASIVVNPNAAEAPTAATTIG